MTSDNRLHKFTAVPVVFAIRARIPLACPGSFASQVGMSLFTNEFITGLGMMTGILSSRLLGPAGRSELAAICANALGQRLCAVREPSSKIAVERSG